MSRMILTRTKFYEGGKLVGARLTPEYIEAEGRRAGRLLARAMGATPLNVTNSLAQDQAALAQRKAAAPLKPKQPQKPMDIGLFSDEANQLDLIEMLMEPNND